MKTRPLAEIAALGALSGAPAGLDPETLVSELREVGIEEDDALAACEALLVRGEISPRGPVLELSPRGGTALLDVHAAIAAALDPSPTTMGMEECPSIPFLTAIRTTWNDAISLGYSVDPEALRALLPAPLEPEIFHGRAFVQVLASRLSELRPAGVPALFGVDFHQVSYRAAVCYRGAEGVRRGGYFVKSQTDHPVMRAIGNALVEFRFHAFEQAAVALTNRGGAIDFVSRPAANDEPEARVRLDVSKDHGLPSTSVFRSIAEVRAALVECYDAFGVADDHVYVLTTDRGAWGARFAKPLSVRVPYMEDGPLGACVLDSVLVLPEPCAYTWRPLRRERVRP